MSLITVAEYLGREKREFPKPDTNGCISYSQFLEAGLPMIVACAHCEMTMALHAQRFIDEDTSEIYCDECGQASQHGGRSD